jgi:hypothetical protein
MRKGQIVKIVAEVITTYAFDVFRRNTDTAWKIIHEPPLVSSGDKSNYRCLCRLEYDTPISVVLLGKTTIQTGIREPEHKYIDDYDPPTFYSDKHHKVWVVVAYSDTDNRYISPFYVLESDIILI